VTDLLRLETYFDAVPRTAVPPESHGPFTLFIPEAAGWSYYARPTLGLDTAITPADVLAVRDRQRGLGIPETFEWIGEVTPSLCSAAAEAGLRVNAYPILVLEKLTRVATAHDIRRISADDPELAIVRGVQHVAFGAPDTAVGMAGIAERDAAEVDVQALGVLRNRLATGVSVLYAAFGPNGPLAAGMHQPVGTVTEIVGVATLPSARRRGLGMAITRALAADALAAGIETVFLSAGSTEVARLYEHVGFRRIGTSMTAEPAAPASRPDSEPARQIVQSEVELKS
jgi:GNAT superfamily N-acetyltransferase